MAGDMALLSPTLGGKLADIGHLLSAVTDGGAFSRFEGEDARGVKI